MKDNRTPIRVCVVEDNAALRESLAVLLGGTPGFLCAGAFGNAEAAVARIPSLKPDVILMDLHLPLQSGVECTLKLKRDLPAGQILVLTVEENVRCVFDALEAGASGYLLKRTPPGRLLEAIQDVHRGGAPMSPQVARLVIETFHNRGMTKRLAEHLTPREREILDLLSKGHRTRDIGAVLSVSPETVHTHLRHIYEKLHVNSSAAAVAQYLGG